MASLLLRKTFSMAKNLSLVLKNPVYIPSMNLTAFRPYAIPKNFMGFRSALFLTSHQLVPIQQVSGLKTKSVLKRRCKDCYMVKRNGRLYIYCKTNAKHKQRHG